MVRATSDLRPSGIPVLGNMPWGTHFCQFYQTPAHLKEVLVPYFKTGLENNELCVWVTSKSVTADEARAALSAVVPDLAQREARGQFEVFPYTDWYLAGGRFDMKRILEGWAAKYRLGVERGFAGLRVSGDTAWLESENWQSFCEYEQSIDGAIENSRILVLCTYSLDRCGPYELLDVVRNHQFALVLGQRGWERIENAELARLREMQQESQEQLRRTAERIRHQNAVLEGINHIFVQSLACDTEEQLGQACLKVVEAVTQGKFGFIGEINAAGQLDAIAISDPGWAACRMAPATGHRKTPGGFRIVGLYGRVLLDGKSFFTNDPARHPDRIGTPPGHPSIDSFLGVPLVHAGRTIGMIAVGNRDGGFREEDLQALEALAGAIVQVLMRHRGEQEVRRARQLAESASRAKDQFIAMLSHELRTPLMPSLAAAGAMIQDPRLPEDVRADAAVIQRNIGLEVALINDLLDVTRIANGKLSLNRSVVDAARILRDAAGICCGDLDAKSQTLTIDMPGAPYPVQADAARLHQVFWNLIKNAIKFTPAQGRIEIAAGRREDRVRIIVKDNGIGIEPAVLPRLFTAFEQGEQSGGFGGLGLGLAIARGLVEAHGGRIGVHSDGRGKGASFTIELPLSPVEEVPPPSESGADAGREPLQVHRPLRILLVEDHADTAKMLARLLTADGHEVVTADCLSTALAAAGGEPGFDVLMSDLGLPDGTGHDLMRQLVAAGRRIHGIAISGYGAAADMQESRDAGFAEHITKPVAFDAVRRALIRIAAGAGSRQDSLPPR